MVTVEEALRLARDAVGVPTPAVERASLDQALGRVLAAGVGMDHDVPPFSRATMDGYAVVAADAIEGLRLQVRGRVAAGDAPGAEVSAGGALRINTGAPIPAGAERIVPVEWVRVESDAIRIQQVPTDNPFIGEAGGHAREGETIVDARRRIDPGVVSALATAGQAMVDVYRQPRVAVLGTGSELVDVSEAPPPGRIRNSNGPMLLAQVARARAIPLDLGVVADDLPGLRAAIRGALLDADLVLLSGGVSKGDLDLVPDALEAEGVRCVFHRWAVQPGGPLWFGMGGGVPFLGLPGNPAASFVAFEVLAVPILAALDGRGFAPRTRLRARYAGPWGKPLVRRRYRPVRLASDEDGVLVAHPETWRGSGDPFVPARMHALAVLPEDVADADEERIIDVLPLEPLG